jgi:hypothetical protein
VTTAEIIKQLEARKQVMAEEMRRAQQQAAQQAALPFQAAIGEIENALAMLRLEGQTETPPSQAG